MRQDLEPLFRETGSITVTTPERISKGIWTGDSPEYIVTDRLSSFEVNSIIDFWLAEHIAFRIDGGGEIGLGKVYRALTLGREMDELLNCAITFVSDPAYEGGIDRISNAGFDVVEASTDGDALDVIRAINPDLIFIDIVRPTDYYLEQLHRMAAAVVNLESFERESTYADCVLNPQRETESSTPDNPPIRDRLSRDQRRIPRTDS